MSASRIMLVAGAVLVVGLVLGLVYALRGDGPPRPVTLAPTPMAPAPTPAASAPVPPPPPPPVRSSPAAPAETTPPADPQAPIVRDHRGQGPTGTPSPIATATITAIRGALESQLRTCAEAAPRPPGDPLHIYMHSTIRVAGGKVSASDFSLTGAEDLGPGYADCVTRAVQGLSIDAPPAQTDGEDLLHMPIRLP